MKKKEDTMLAFLKENCRGFVLVSSVSLFLSGISVFLLYKFDIIKDTFKLDLGIILTIASIFIGFFLSILLNVNNRITSIDVDGIKNSDDQSYARRYINYSKKFAANIIYGLIIILLAMGFSGIIMVSKTFWVKAIFLTLFSSAGLCFLVALFRTIKTLFDFLSEDFRSKDKRIDLLDKIFRLDDE